MFDPKTLDDMAQRLAGMVPQGARDLQRDVEKNVRALLSSTFAKLDLVTREEFEVQKAVLERTRARLTALEAQVALLESRVLGRDQEGVGGGEPGSGAQGLDIP